MHFSLLSKVDHRLLFAGCRTKWGLDASRGFLPEKGNQESVNIRGFRHNLYYCISFQNLHYHL